MSMSIQDSFKEQFKRNNSFDPALYDRYPVKRGLRNADGTGVLAGITQISNVHGYIIDEGDKRPAPGKLTFRGYDVEQLVDYARTHDRWGFEDVAFLLLAGELPNQEQTRQFQELIDRKRDLPNGFTYDVLMRYPSDNLMNMLMHAVAVLYTYDRDPEAVSEEHELDCAIDLLARLPRIAVLAHYARIASFKNESMIIHPPVPGYSTAETFLSNLRPNREFTHEEACMLDTMLMLHAEHGGGNNSTFTTRVLTSAGTDPYSTYAAAIGSLKGSKHGGANLKVLGLQSDLKSNVANWCDEGAIADYLDKVLRKEAYDRSGLVYGMGHAVYTLSDPRAVICKKYARQLAAGTEAEAELDLLERVERIAPQVIARYKGDAKQICANIDMYSGFVYHMLGIPDDLLTPLFAISRITGWAAHRFEELVSGKRIIRPAYKSIAQERDILVSQAND
ncbi:MAG: citrate synthase [Coriobacteriales bacterium]|nr:citrate synthase [Coriobacteriales bacterium]